MRRLLLLPLVAAALAGLATQVIAAGDDIRQIKPKARQSFKALQHPRPTFEVRIPGGLGPKAGASYEVFMRASTRKRLRDGLIGKDAFVGKMNQVNSSTLFRLTPDPGRRYRFNKYWLNHRDTYYWQAYYIQCLTQDKACIHAGHRRVIRITRR